MLDVGSARPIVCELARVEQLEVVLELVSLRGTREDVHAEAGLAAGRQQLLGGAEGSDLGDELVVPVPLELAHTDAEPSLDSPSRDSLDQVVAAHADVPMDPPARHLHADLVEGPRPGEGVLVYRIDEGAVDVEDHRLEPPQLDAHQPALPLGQARRTARVGIGNSARRRRRSRSGVLPGAVAELETALDLVLP